ncbi:hypothetical protein D9611_009107 [Ephemerocybe angulata]|nr:hypothetical protein D9611_009107 [Tulosesus angulatus]
MSAGQTPIYREAFISPDHVQTALRGPNWPHQPAMMSVLNDNGKLHEVPVPAEWVQQGILPDGYAVDFLFDPEEVVAKLKNAGGTYMEQIPGPVYENMVGIVNAVNNLKIVPQWLYDQKRGLISNAVAQGVTPEVLMQQRRDQAEQEGSELKKEKKKGFLKGLFGKK